MEKERITTTSFWVCLVTSLVLIVGGFLVPPIGVIDGSVLTAVGEIFGFAALGSLPKVLKAHNAKITHGDMTIEVSRKEDEDADSDC